MHSEDVQAELDELSELWGVEKRSAPDNEHATTRDKRTKQLRELFSKRKAERVKAIEAAGHARVVAAAGRPGAVERSDGVTALAGQTFAAEAIERDASVQLRRRELRREARRALQRTQRRAGVAEP